MEDPRVEAFRSFIEPSCCHHALLQRARLALMFRGLEESLYIADRDLDPPFHVLNALSLAKQIENSQERIS